MAVKDVYHALREAKRLSVHVRRDVTTQDVHGCPVWVPELERLPHAPTYSKID